MLNAKTIYSRLKKEYKTAKIFLFYSNPLELLVAVMLSAQCTDVRVNLVTKELFKRYKKAKDYAFGDIDELKRYIKSAGFYNAKAKHIQESCKTLVEKYNGQVPDTMEGLLELPGVARKTANIVLSEGFGTIEGMAIDRHNVRILNRLWLTKSDDPTIIEKEMMKKLPRKAWPEMSHLIIDHGRKICIAITPKCSVCPLNKLCPKVGVTKHT
jgi:endonuclease-3